MYFNKKRDKNMISIKIYRQDDIEFLEKYSNLYDFYYAELIHYLIRYYKRKEKC